KTVAIAHERRSCRRARARRPDRTVHALDIGVLPAGASQAPSADPVRSRRFALYSPRQSQRPGQEGGNGLACRLPHPWCIQLATYLEVEDEKAFPPVAADPLTSAARHDWPWRLPPRALDAVRGVAAFTVILFILTS